MSLSNFVKRIQNIMRYDSGINGDAQRIEQMTWLLFLKIYGSKEQSWAFHDKGYQSIIPTPLQWQHWAVDQKDGQALTGENLLTFVNQSLIPTLKNLTVNAHGRFCLWYRGGLTSSLKYLEPQIKTLEDRASFQKSLYGIEKKPLPHMLCVTNMLLHDIDSPMIVHGNGLEHNVRETAAQKAPRFVIISLLIYAAVKQLIYLCR